MELIIIFSLKLKNMNTMFTKAVYKKTMPLFFLLTLLSITSFSQTFPSVSSCTSKDLELVRAEIDNKEKCKVCDPGSTQTKDLLLTIFNKTGSTRTSFAFWGTLVETQIGGNIVESPISGCGGPVAKNSNTTLTFAGKLSYKCGSALSIKNLFLAWTDASPNSTCPLNSALIAPKCGTLAVIPVDIGLSASYNKQNGTCGTSGTPTNGSIDVSVNTGKTPYTYAWTTTGGTLSNPANAEDQTSLPAGLYSVSITDANGCKVEFKDIQVTVPSKPTATPTPVNGTCGSDGAPTPASITLGVSGGTSPYTFVWSNNATTKDLSNIPAATYSVTVTDANGCKDTKTGIVVTTQVRPANAAISKVDPGLCGPATGSITICSPTGSGIQYSKDGGANWQSGTTFGSLAAGSSPSILVKNSAGCWSATPTPCTSAAPCVTTAANNPLAVVEEQKITSLGSRELEEILAVRAMPNPFSNQVRFTIKSATSGMGSLDIYNMQGQKIKTVYSGYIHAGTSYFDLKLANGSSSQLMYVLNMNGERVTGKLLKTN
jgi:hypothetical protein